MNGSLLFELDEILKDLNDPLLPFEDDNNWNASFQDLPPADMLTSLSPDFASNSSTDEDKAFPKFRPNSESFSLGEQPGRSAVEGSSSSNAMCESSSPISVLEGNVSLFATNRVCFSFRPIFGIPTKRERSKGRRPSTTIHQFALGMLSALNDSSSKSKSIENLKQFPGSNKTKNHGDQAIIVPRKCMHCQVTSTPQWREGPGGSKTLCNACGVRYKSGRLFPEYRPASSPTFVPPLHSNRHKKVIQLSKSGRSRSAG